MTTRPAVSAESGFVLIGVVIFVIALTIIGISLFSLSSYEAQFLQRSLDGEQAFQSAVGGMERARFLLCQRSRLDSIAILLPGEWNVASASAVEYLPSGDSITTEVDWDTPGSSVRLRVTARVNHRERTVEARYAPGRAADYYRRLVTVGGGIVVSPTYGGTNRIPTVLLDGAVWDSRGNPSTWTSRLRAPLPAPILTSPTVITPEADDFIARNPTAASVPFAYPYPPPNGTTLVFTLDGQSEPVSYWATDGSVPNWSLYVGFMSETGVSDPRADRTQVHVGGAAIWMFPRGVEFQHQVQIRALPGGPANDCLVIVAGANGIRFLGGIQASIPVILVSSGQVAIRHENDNWGASVDGWADDLSIFAGSLDLMGPDFRHYDTATTTQYDNHMELHHPAAGLLNQTFLPLLAGNGALPNASSTTNHLLTLQSPTWRVSAP